MGISALPAGTTLATAIASAAAIGSCTGGIGWMARRPSAWGGSAPARSMAMAGWLLLGIAGLGGTLVVLASLQLAGKLQPYHSTVPETLRLIMVIAGLLSIPVAPAVGFLGLCALGLAALRVSSVRQEEQ